MASLTRRSPWSAEDGAALIEFAIALPLMLLVLLGTIDFGMMFQRYEVVTNAAREGARISVLPGYAAGDVDARVRQFLGAGGFTAAEVATVVITVGAPEALPVGVGGQCIIVRPVTVAYPYQYSAIGGIASYFGGADFSSTGLQATAAMRNEFAAGLCS